MTIALVYDPRYHTFESWASLMCEAYAGQQLQIPGPDVDFKSWGAGFKSRSPWFKSWGIGFKSICQTKSPLPNRWMFAGHVLVKIILTASNIYFSFYSVYMDL